MTIYVEVQLHFHYTDHRGEDTNAVGLRVSLRTRFKVLSGFYGEELVTGSDGKVSFNVPGHSEYTIWIDHEEFENIGTGDRDEWRSYVIDEDYQVHYGSSSSSNVQHDSPDEGEEGSPADDRRANGSTDDTDEGESPEPEDESDDDDSSIDRGSEHAWSESPSYDSSSRSSEPPDDATIDSRPNDTESTHNGESISAESYGDNASTERSYSTGGGSSGASVGGAGDLVGWAGCFGPIIGVVSWLAIWLLGGCATWIYTRSNHSDAETDAFDPFGKTFSVGFTVGVVVWMFLLGAAVWRVVRRERAAGQVNHLLHLFITVITGGLWLPFWITHSVLVGRAHPAGVLRITALAGGVVAAIVVALTVITAVVALWTRGACSEGMVRISGGTFLMGSLEGIGDRDEHPQHRARISAFCMDRTEATVASWRQCVAAGACTPPVVDVGDHGFDAFNWNHENRDQHPVNGIDWGQALAYCQWRGGRLPTEAEWEFAARGTEGRTFPWGESAPTPAHANLCGSECDAWLRAHNVGSYGAYVVPGWSDPFPTSSPVGSFPDGATPEGLLDMAGNAWEWTADWYEPSYLSASFVGDPRGPARGNTRVIRGGIGLVRQVSAAHRLNAMPTVHDYLVGVRCARTL